jgi:hypothetical protein
MFDKRSTATSSSWSPRHYVNAAATLLFVYAVFHYASAGGNPTTTQSASNPAAGGTVIAALQPLQLDEWPAERDALPLCALNTTLGAAPRGEVKGQWIATAAAPAYTYAQCPLMLKTFACAEFDGPAARVVARRRFYPRTCAMRAFHADAFLSCARGRRILFIGDSLTQQHFMSLSCLLTSGRTVRGDAVRYIYNTDRTVKAVDVPERVHKRDVAARSPHIRVKDEKGDLGGEVDNDMWHAKAVCTKNSWFGDRCPYRTASVFFPDYDSVNLELVRYERYTPATWNQLMKYYGSYATDVIVFNVGLFYLKDLKAFKADTEAMIVHLLSDEYPGMIFLRETSQAHFADAADGTYHSAQRQPCEPLRSFDNGYRAYWKIVVDVVTRCRRGDAIGGTPQPSRCTNIHLLPTYGAAYSQWDAHFGMFGERPWARNVTDCQHWCNPSGAIDEWSTHLFNLMCNKPVS